MPPSLRAIAAMAALFLTPANVQAQANLIVPSIEDADRVAIAFRLPPGTATTPHAEAPSLPRSILPSGLEAIDVPESASPHLALDRESATEGPAMAAGTFDGDAESAEVQPQSDSSKYQFRVPDRYAAGKTGWTNDLVALEVAFQVANALDAVTTDRCVRRPSCKEVNPLFGKKPSSGVIYGAKAAAGLIHYFAIDMLTRADTSTARTVAWVSTIFQTGIVGINLSQSF